jgi:hypothetical protein
VAQADAGEGGQGVVAAGGGGDLGDSFGERRRRQDAGRLARLRQGRVLLQFSARTGVRVDSDLHKHVTYMSVTF